MALKIDSPDILHKTEADGVRVGLQNVAAVAQAFEDIRQNALRHHPGALINGVLVQAMSPQPLVEMICGMQRDAVFGLVLLVGMGGVLVEVLQDAAMRVAPVSAHETRRMWQELAGAALLQGYRGRPKADTDALEALLRKVAALGAAVPEIRQMDLNPVMVMPAQAGLHVVDCRILLAEA